MTKFTISKIAMNQNFPLMKQLIPLLFHRKIITNRALIRSEITGEFFRRKCDVGNLMYFWDDYRQKGMKLVGVGYVLETAEWNINKIPRNPDEARKVISPKKDMKWSGFAWYDGFNDYIEFVNYFINHIKKVEDFKMFHFREAKEGEIPRRMYEKL